MENLGINWQNKRVLVTGATGFLGSYLTRDLANAGAIVTVLERDYEPHSNFYRLGLDRTTRKVIGDVSNFFLMERILNEHEIEVVFHLAAQPLVLTANRAPLSTFESNMRGTWMLLEAARQSPLKPKVVVASSDKAYGDSIDLPYREIHPLRGAHPYDVSKTCTDLLAQSYFATYRLPISIVRCGNFYGGGDLHWSRIVPGTLRSLIRNENPVIRSDGTLKRDYFYIEDVARAYLAVGARMDDEKIWGEAFNFGTETPVSAREMVNKMIAITGKTNLQPEVLGQNHGEIAEQYLSTEKARTILGWRPTFSLDDGLAAAYRWYQEFFKS